MARGLELLYEGEDEAFEEASSPVFEKTQKTKMRRDDVAAVGKKKYTQRVQRPDKED